MERAAREEVRSERPENQLEDDAHWTPGRRRLGGPPRLSFTIRRRGRLGRRAADLPRQVHEELARLSRGSARLRPRRDHPNVLAEEVLWVDQLVSGRELPQDAYTLRCVPQLVGAVWDVVDAHDRQVETKLNAVTDNPPLFPESGRVLHVGNFFGQQIAFASDSYNVLAIEGLVLAQAFDLV